MYKKNLETVIVTRHASLVDVLREQYPELDGCKVISHSTAEDVAGKHVFGVLPLDLAAAAAKVTTITLRIPADLRGVELTADQVRQYMTKGKTYRVFTEDDLYQVELNAYRLGHNGFDFTPLF